MSHEAYVLAAYGASALGVSMLALWMIMDQRGRKRDLAQLEASGVRRRSAEPGA